MNGSSVVYGLKSLTSKLHPQLPLTSKEAQRLLTALKTSFRQQLDEAYPREVGGDEAKPKAGRGAIVKKADATGAHLHTSSTALADRHLASLLTNPLLVKEDGTKKPPLDHATAKTELETYPRKDPVSLLEEYHKKGAASISIALLCLEAFQKSLDNYPTAGRKNAIAATEAGKRTLLLLWNANLVKTDEFVDNKTLMNLAVSLTIEEGHEELLWDWIKSDSTRQDQTSYQYHSQGLSEIYRSRRWKGVLLRAIVKRKLDESSRRSADAALTAFLRGCALKKDMEASGKPHSIPLGQAMVFLHKWIRHFPDRASKTNVDLFEAFIHISALTYKGRQDFETSILYLVHPQKPSPLPGLLFLRTVAEHEAEQASSVKRNVSLFKNPWNASEQMARHMFMMRVAAQLQDRGLTNDADWVINETKRLFPDLARYIERDLRRYRKVSEPSAPRDEAEHDRPEGIPFPHFVRYQGG